MRADRIHECIQEKRGSRAKAWTQEEEQEKDFLHVDTLLNGRRKGGKKEDVGAL